MSDGSMIEFVLKAKDMMSNVFPKVALTAHNSFNKIQADIDKIQRPIKLSVDDSGLTRAGNMFKNILGGNLAANAISSVLSKSREFLAESIQASMENAMRAKSFEVLTGSAGAGGELLGQLRDLKQSTIMGASVYQNAQTLMGFGVGRGEIIRDLKQIGDIAMGDKERMQSLTLAYAQIRAAGKLAGQDMLQLVTAGFNPLQVMSERWKEFGFKTKMGVGQLKDLMSQGGISAGMVAKAFELATSKGGQFYGMMDKIGETAGGKMLKLEGAIAALKIDIGNKLLPFTTGLAEAATKLVHWADSSQNGISQIVSERVEISSLVGMVTDLNISNTDRLALITKLTEKYPQFFGNIDKETVANETLLGILQKVNKTYEERIRLAGLKGSANELQTQVTDAATLASKAYQAAEMMKQTGQSFGSYDVFNILGANDWSKLYYNKVADASSDLTGPSSSDLVKIAQEQTKLADSLQSSFNVADRAVKLEELNQLVEQGFAKYNDNQTPVKMQKALHGELAKIVKAQMGGVDSFLNYDYSRLKKLIGEDSKTPKDDPYKALMDMLSKISTGGQRQVHINFRNVVENMYNNVEGGKTAVEKIEPELEEMVNRVFKKVV